MLSPSTSMPYPTSSVSPSESVTRSRTQWMSRKPLGAEGVPVSVGGVAVPSRVRPGMDALVERSHHCTSV